MGYIISIYYFCRFLGQSSFTELIKLLDIFNKLIYTNNPM